MRSARAQELDTLDGEREEEVEKLRLRNISLRAEVTCPLRAPGWRKGLALRTHPLNALPG